MAFIRRSSSYLEDYPKVDYKRVRLFKDKYLRKAYQTFLQDKELKKNIVLLLKEHFG